MTDGHDFEAAAAAHSAVPVAERGTTPGGVRAYAAYTAIHALRRWWVTRRVASLGEGVYVEPNVRLLRHPENISLGDRVMLKEGARLCPTNARARLSIGDWTTIGYHTFLFATTRIDIGANCLIAPFCYLVDSNHGIARDRLIREQPMHHAPISIGSDVWLGVGVTVTAGVTIGDGAVIGARAVVNENIPPYAVAVGTPAKVIRYR